MFQGGRILHQTVLHANIIARTDASCRLVLHGLVGLVWWLSRYLLLIYSIQFSAYLSTKYTVHLGVGLLILCGYCAHGRGQTVRMGQSLLLIIFG